MIDLTIDQGRLTTASGIRRGKVFRKLEGRGEGSIASAIRPYDEKEAKGAVGHG